MAQKPKEKGKPAEEKKPKAEKPAEKPTAGKPPAAEKPMEKPVEVPPVAPEEKPKEKAKKPPKVRKPGKKAYTRYKIDEQGLTLTRLLPYCERCGPGYFMADHGDRFSCGHCGFTRYKRA
jgi:small subunit ribosomal protein S27Ae